MLFSGVAGVLRKESWRDTISPTTTPAGFRLIPGSGSDCTRSKEHDDGLQHPDPIWYLGDAPSPHLCGDAPGKALCPAPRGSSICCKGRVWRRWNLCAVWNITEDLAAVSSLHRSMEKWLHHQDPFDTQPITGDSRPTFPLRLFASSPNDRVYFPHFQWWKMNLDEPQKDILILTSLVILGAFENVATHQLCLSFSSVSFYLGTRDKAVGQ